MRTDDLCWGCTEKIGGDPAYNDFAHLVSESKCTKVLCGGCGQQHINHRGQVLNFVAMASAYRGPKDGE